MKRSILYIICMAACAAMLTGCIEDGISMSPSDQPVAEVDTLRLGTVFTGDGTPTARFKIYNRHDKIISIDRIALREQDGDARWRFNVDGLSGSSFEGVEIRPNDSIYIFVEVTLPDLHGLEPREYVGHLDFTTRGVTSPVVLTVNGVDAERLRGVTVGADSVLTAERPYIVYDSLVVAEGATLTLRPGTRLHFHSDAYMRVDGTLISDGTPAEPVEMTGDRFGTVVGRVDYEIMSGQWGGVTFTSTSRANEMAYTSIRNSTWGVNVIGSQYDDFRPALRIVNCQLRNTKEYVLASFHSSVEALGCELADASAGVVWLRGGRARLSSCTIANNYLFTAVGPSLQLSYAWPDEEDVDESEIGLPLLRAEIDNSIIYGIGADLSHGDLTGSSVSLRNCLLRSAGSDDDNFINCLWDLDPMFYTVRADYHFDYRLKPESPAIGAADPSLIPRELTTDRYGTPRTDLSLGAYSTEL